MSLLKSIENQINRLIDLDEEGKKNLGRLSGKTIEIDILNTDLRIYLQPSAEKLHFLENIDKKPDVTIRGTPGDLIIYLLNSRESSTAIAANIEVTGDVGLAQSFQTAMKNLDIDWEEQLSHWFGDTLAHKMGRFLRGTVEYTHYSMNKLQLDISEYLRYEKDVTVNRIELEEFTRGVDMLRNDIERLKIRISRLERD